MTDKITNDKEQPRIAVCGVGGTGSLVLDIFINKSQNTFNSDSVNIKTICFTGEEIIVDRTKADITIFSPYPKGMLIDYPIGYFRYEETVQEFKKLLYGFDYIIYLCGLGYNSGFTVIEAFEYMNNKNCIQFIIASLPVWFEGQRVKIADKNLKEIKSIGIPHYIVKLDALVEKIKLENISVTKMFDEAKNIMSDKAVEIVRQIIETGRIEQ